MPVSQLDNFPPRSKFERSWELDQRALAQSLFPVNGVLSGLNITLGTLLTPGFSDGVILSGDKLIGPFATRLVEAAPASRTRWGLFYNSSKGQMEYKALTDTTLTANDVLVAEFTTNTTKLVMVSQYLALGAGRVGVRGRVDIENTVLASDITVGVITRPPGYRTIKVESAYARVATIVGTGNADTDNFLLKANATTLVTLPGTSLGTLNAREATGTPVFIDDDVTVSYNQTDASNNITNGVIDFFAEFSFIP